MSCYVRKIFSKILDDLFNKGSLVTFHLSFVINESNTPLMLMSKACHQQPKKKKKYRTAIHQRKKRQLRLDQPDDDSKKTVR